MSILRSSFRVVYQDLDSTKSVPSWRKYLACLIALACLSTTVAVAQEDEVSAKANPETSASNSATIDFLYSGKEPTSIDQLREMEKHVANLAKRTFPATVNIRMGAAQGTGVVVSSDGYILTAAHVISSGPDDTAYITFMNEDGKVGREVKAKRLGIDESIDSGMLKIEESEEDFPYLDVGISEDLDDGQWVMAVGHPGGLDEKRGLVVRIGRIVFRSDRVIKTDCTLVGGDSGGPLIDMNGDVIGIHSRIGQRLMDNLHVPVDTYSENWDRLAEGVILSGQPTMGFSVDGETNKIKSVVKDGPADKAGIKDGDLLIEIDDITIASRSDIHKARVDLDLKPNMTIEVVVMRDGEEVTLSLKVGNKSKRTR